MSKEQESTKDGIERARAAGDAARAAGDAAWAAETKWQVDRGTLRGLRGTYSRGIEQR